MALIQSLLLSIDILLDKFDDDISKQLFKNEY